MEDKQKRELQAIVSFEYEKEPQDCDEKIFVTTDEKKSFSRRWSAKKSEICTVRDETTILKMDKNIPAAGNDDYENEKDRHLRRVYSNIAVHKPFL